MLVGLMLIELCSIQDKLSKGLGCAWAAFLSCNLVTTLLGGGGGFFALGARPILFKRASLLLETPGAGFAAGAGLGTGAGAAGGAG